ncbi:MAG TPA: tail fiber domain-containing protein, partial [Gammaproteobacteria bacterium]|nr:tail fiber domain-containing protein [Gammaproteobacteria bacterium]
MLSTKLQAVVPAPDGAYPGGNTAEGQSALFSLTTGGYNTAIGWKSLYSDTTGTANTGVGAGTLLLNTADGNTATGAAALLLNQDGTRNTANGAFALLNNTSGSDNTAVGHNALAHNTASTNTAVGSGALSNNEGGDFSCALGLAALGQQTSGYQNTAVGAFALLENTQGVLNTALGVNAGFHVTGNGNICIGANAGSNNHAGNDNIYIGNPGLNVESNNIVIGTSGIQNSTYIAGINGATVPGGAAVIVDITGHLGTINSSKRFKEEIKPMDKASEALLALRPVTFRYKKELDPDRIPQFGLVAEEVAKVNPDLVLRDADGEIYTVRYEAVNAMLLNEFLKEHKKVEQQQASIVDLKATVAQQHSQFHATTAEQRKQIQDLTAQ